MPNNRPIRILRIIARLNVGGPAIQAVTLSADMTGDHYKTLLVTGRVGRQEGDMSYLAGEMDITPQILPELGRDISLFDDVRTFRALRKITRRFEPDIIHTHTAKAGSLGRLTGIILNLTRGRKKRIRLVHTFHGHVFYGYFNPLKTAVFIFIEKILALFTDRIIVISHAQHHDICRRYRVTGSKKARIIPLGFDLSRFEIIHHGYGEVRKRYLPRDSGGILLVGIIGRLTGVKNHRMFLEAVKQLKDEERIVSFRFLIIGDGELRETLEDYAGELEVEDYVAFTGWQRDMPSIYRALDIVVLTSLNEGTPVTLIEAMAAGRPVIATDVGGVRDLFGPVRKIVDNDFQLAQNGILIPSGRCESLTRALLYLEKNRDASVKMITRAREYVMGRYSKERLVKDMESLYSELVGHSSIVNRQ